MLKQFILWVERSFTFPIIRSALRDWLTSRRTVHVGPKRKRALRPVSVNSAAANVGLPFDQPWNQQLPEGYFWKQDEGELNIPHLLLGTKRKWRIYKRAIDSRYYH